MYVLIKKFGVRWASSEKTNRYDSFVCDEDEPDECLYNVYG